MFYRYASEKRALYSYFIVTLVIKAPSVLHLIPMLVIRELYFYFIATLAMKQAVFVFDCYVSEKSKLYLNFRCYVSDEVRCVCV